MEYIIEIQDLRGQDNAFLPKEIAVLSTEGETVGHWIIAQPFEFSTLPSDIKTTNDFISSRIHGIHWFDGDMSLNKLRHHLYKIARNAVRIYVRGSEKAEYLQGIMARTVIDVEEYTNSGFADLQKQFTCSQLCHYHACLRDEYKHNYCTLRRVYVLRQWLRSLVPEGPASDSKDVYYESLRELIYRKKQEKVKFRIGHTSIGGRDVVDYDSETSDSYTEDLAISPSENEYSRNLGSSEGLERSNGRSLRRRSDSKSDDAAC